MEQTLIDKAEDAFWKKHDSSQKKNVSDKAYREFREHPLLLLHYLEPHSEPVITLPEDCKMVAIGLSFPTLSAESQRVPYRINLVEVRNLLRSEADASDDEDEEDDDA